MQTLINAMASLKEYAYWCIILVGVLIVSLRCNAKLYQKKKCKQNWNQLFFVLDKKQMLSFSLNLSMLAFFVSSCFRFQQLNIVHVLFFSLNFVLCLLCSFQIKLALYNAFNSILCAVALIALNMLYQYMILMHTPTQFLIIYLCGGCCISLYAGYVFFYELYLLIRGRKIQYG